MKNNARLFFAAATLVAASSANAATYYFDGGTTDIAATGNGATAATDGTWNTTTLNWDQGAGLAHIAWPNSSADTAAFGGNNTVTVSGSVNVGAITVANSGNSRLSFQNGTFTFGATGAIDSSATQSTGSAGTQLNTMTLAGDITNGLTLTGGNTNGNAAQSYANRFNASDSATVLTRFNNLVMNNNVNGTFTGAVTITNGVEMQGNSGQRYAHLGAATNNVTLNNGTLYLYLGGAGGTTTFDHNIAVTGANNALNTNNNTANVVTISGNITSTGADTLWSVTNTLAGSKLIYTGDLSGFAGTLQVRGHTTAGSLTGGTTVMDSTGTFGGTLAVHSGILQIGNGDTKGSLGSNNIVNNGTIQYSRIDGQNYAGNLSGTGALKVTGGSLTLSGTNTHTGATTVSAGTLTVAATGAIRVNGADGITVAAGATLALAGTLNVHSVTDTIKTIDNTSIFTAGGILDLHGVFDGYNGGADGSTYTLITGAGTKGGGFTGFSNLGASWSSVSYNGATGVLTFTAVPEPSTYGLMGAGALAASALVRRRRKVAGKVA